MEYIYSKISPGRLLHIINKFDDIEPRRKDIIPPNNFLQIATIRLDNEQTFRAHRHVWNNFNNSKLAQESWIIVRGKVRAILYDLDNIILREVVLCSGDFSITLEGGHNYISLSSDTLVYEVKTGPYEGQEKDKVFI